MATRLELPIELAPAAHFALTHQADHLATHFIAAIRAGTRFDPRLPLALLALCHRVGTALDERALLAVTLTGFAARPQRRARRLAAAGGLMMAGAILSDAMGRWRERRQPTIWSMDSGTPVLPPSDLLPPHPTRVLSDIPPRLTSGPPPGTDPAPARPPPLPHGAILTR